MTAEKATKNGSAKGSNQISDFQTQQPSGGSMLSAEDLSKILTNIPKGVSTTLDKLLETEARLKGFDKQIMEIKDLLKPISRIEKRRGIKPKVTGGMKAYYKGALKRLQQERFIEAENWAKLMKEFGQTIKNDVKKTRNEFLLVKAKSNRYVSKNILMVINRFKDLFQNLHETDQNKLTILKEKVGTLEGDVLSEFIRTFLQENDSAKFLSTMYANLVSSQALDLQTVVHQIIAQLLNPRNAGTGQSFPFKEINVLVAKKRM
jgi:hypothetical protein